MPETKKELLGKRIRAFRKRARMTQEQFAERVDIDARHLSRLETGRHFPSLDTLERMADVLNVPMAEFFRFPDLDTPAALRKFLTDFAERAGEDQLRLAVKAVKLVVM